MTRRAVFLGLVVLIVGCHTERRFADPVEPLRDHWVILRVKLHVPLEVPDESTRAVGYYRNLGVRCAPERVRDIVTSDVQDGAIVWSDTEWSAVVIDDLHQHIRDRTTLPAGEGIWYRSGRIYFPGES